MDRAFAEAWYRDGWIRAWNENKPELCHEILTEDFVLDSPTTRHTGTVVKGPDAAGDYIRYVLAAYPDLQWEITAPPMYSDTEPRAAYSWRGTGHFTGVFDPPGIAGNGRAFEFAGLEVFDFRGDRACYLYAAYGLYRRASAEG